MSSYVDNGLNAKIDARIREMLGSSVNWPDDFKAGLPRYLETNPPALQMGDIQGLYTMDNTVSSLGAKVNGRVGMIRSGSSPYEYLRLTYDSVYGKWLSDPELAVSVDSSVLFTNTSYAVQPLSAGSCTNLLIVNALDYYTAGLRPQISWAASLDCSADGITINAQPSILEFSTGTNPTAGALVAHTTGMQYVRAGGASSHSVQAWEDVTFDLTPSLANWYFCWRAKVSSGTGELINGRSSFRVRWVG